MGPEPFMQAVVEAAIFLETSNEDILDPDTAVSQLEQMASILQDLDPDYRRFFSEYVSKLARDETRLYGQTERVSILESLIENLGLVEDDRSN